MLPPRVLSWSLFALAVLAGWRAHAQVEVSASELAQNVGARPGVAPGTRGISRSGALGGVAAWSGTGSLPATQHASGCATADSLEIENPWHARSASLIDAKDLDSPGDAKTGVSAYLKGASAEKMERVRRCAHRKEAMDGRLHALGARYLAGSGTPRCGVMPGSGLHLELALLLRIGLFPREALAAATSNFADACGWKDVGRIEPGRRADLLLLDADPRKDVAALRHIRTLVVAGEVVDREALLKKR